MEEWSDIALIQKIKKGDQASFTLLVDRHKNYAYKLALRILSSEEDAEEAANDAFVQFYVKADSFKGNAKFTTWFYRIVVNCALSRLRKKKLPISDTEVADVPTFANDDTGLDCLAAIDRSRYINAAVSKLGEEERVLIGLYYTDELDMDEIEDLTGLTKNYMKVKLFRARKKLASNLAHLLEGELESIK